MELDFSITVKTKAGTLHVQGLNIDLSANYKKGFLPDSILINAMGNINPTPQNPGTYILVNGSYDIAKESFAIMNSSGITESFLSELKTNVLEFYDKIKTTEDVQV